MFDRRSLLKLSAIAGGAIAMPGWSLASDDRPIDLEILLTRSRVLVPVRIGNSSPYLFLLDTGGYLSLIDKALAERLKLPLGGVARSHGVGGAADMPIYMATDVVFGGRLRQKEVAFAGAAGGHFGRNVVGAVAAGFLTSRDSELDFDAQRWRLWPDRRKNFDGLTKLDSRITAGFSGPRAGSKRLFAKAELDGRSYMFLLDTGAPRGVMLFRQAAHKSGLWDDSRPWAPVRQNGIGGASGIGRQIRGRSLSLGGTQLADPIVTLSADDQNGIAEGVIGLDILRLFDIATDIRGNAIWVRRNGMKSMRDEGSRIGLWVTNDNGRTMVSAVGTGSPAAAAGLRIGDEIARPGYADLVRQFYGPSGSTLVMSVMRDGVARDVTVTLRPYL